MKYKNSERLRSLLRGAGADPSRPSSNVTVSIPTRYKTILLNNDRSKAFGSSSDRFGADPELRDEPGPGSYSLYRESLYKDNVESYSRKGHGGLCDRESRKKPYMRTGPGPASYNYSHLDSMVSKAKTERSISYEVMVMNKIRERINNHKKEAYRVSNKGAKSLERNIGPGTYNTEMRKKISNLSKVSFTLNNKDKEEQGRVEGSGFGVSPDLGPGSYEIPRDILNQKKYDYGNLSSAFRKPTNSKMNIQSTDLDSIKRHIIYGGKEREALISMRDAESSGFGREARRIDQVPGVGEYEVEASFQKLYGQKEYNTKVGVTMQGAKRFTAANSIVPQNATSGNAGLGPGSYESTRSSFDTTQYKVYHSVFMSETSREVFEVK